MRKRFWGKTLALSAALSLCGGAWANDAIVTADATPAGQITFTKDVLPILQENCQECHRPQAIGVSGMVAPMPMMDYETTRPWAKAIAKAVQSRYMPPWFASQDFHGVFRNERTLTEAEIATLVKWAETGAKRGNPADAPAPRTFRDDDWWLGEPDLIVPLPEKVWVGDEVSDWQPNIEIELTEEQLPEPRWMRTVECQADSQYVHHIVLYAQHDSYADGFGKQIGGLAPGAEPAMVQDGYGILLRPGTTLRVNMHYHKEAGPGTGEYDQSRLGFFFYPEDAKVKEINIEPVGSMDFEIPPLQSAWKVGMATTFERPISVLSYLPHMHLRGVEAEYTAFTPDGKAETVLDVPEYDYNWQLYYEYPEPRKFPAGTRMEALFTFDNSPDNESNPDPNRAVPWGIDTSDEMAFGWMYYAWSDDVTRTAEEAAARPSEGSRYSD